VRIDDFTVPRGWQAIMNNISVEEPEDFSELNKRFGNLEQLVEELNYQFADQGGKISLSGWKAQKEQFGVTVVFECNGELLKTIRLRSRPPGLFFRMEKGEEVPFRDEVAKVHSHIRHWAEQLLSLPN
jgi:hypothetical protein